MAPPERVADHLSLVIEQARLKPEAKRQKVDDTNLESSKTTEHALVVLTSPVYQEKLSKTAKALAAPGGGITSYRKEACELILLDYNCIETFRCPHQRQLCVVYLDWPISLGFMYINMHT